MLDEDVKETFKRLWEMDPDEYTDMSQRQGEFVVLPDKRMPLTEYQWTNLSVTNYLEGNFLVWEHYPLPGLISTYVTMPFIGRLDEDDETVGGVVLSASFPLVGYLGREDPVLFMGEEFSRRFHQGEYLWPGRGVRPGSKGSRVSSPGFLRP